MSSLKTTTTSFSKFVLPIQWVKHDTCSMLLFGKEAQKPNHTFIFYLLTKHLCKWRPFPKKVWHYKRFLRHHWLSGEWPVWRSSSHCHPNCIFGDELPAQHLPPHQGQGGSDGDPVGAASQLVGAALQGSMQLVCQVFLKWGWRSTSPAAAAGGSRQNDSRTIQVSRQLVVDIFCHHHQFWDSYFT